MTAAQVDDLAQEDRQLRNHDEGTSLARAAARGGQVGSALDIFPAEEELFEAEPCLETVDSTSRDDRVPTGEGRPAQIDDTDERNRARPQWFVSWLIVALIVIAIPVAVVITLLAVAMPFGLVWLLYAGLIQPVIRTEAAVIVLNPVPRMMLFTAWLFLMGVGAVALIRVLDIIRSHTGLGGTDSVIWAVATSVSSVLMAFGLSSWVVDWLLRFVR